MSASSRRERASRLPEDPEIFDIKRFNCSLSVVLLLDKGITPKIRMLCFVLLNTILFDLLCVWVLFHNASRQSCFSFVVVVVTVVVVGCIKRFFFFFFLTWICDGASKTTYCYFVKLRSRRL